MSQRPLPTPATQADEYLYAIASELKNLALAMADLVAVLTPAPAAPVAELPAATVDLSEPASDVAPTKGKGKPAAKLSE